MTRSSCLSALVNNAPVVLPSLLLCDFGNLEREVRDLEEAGARALHLDVMDGNFVPNLTYGLPIVSALRQLTELTLDTHLMIRHPENYVQAFFDAGADVITIHVEATTNPVSTLENIRRTGAAAGIAINPGTPLSALQSCRELCDLVLIMSVEAGFGGQAFNPVALDRLRQIRGIVGETAILEVDGGINRDTINDCALAGAQLFVAGSAVFGQSNYGDALEQLTRIAKRF